MALKLKMRGDIVSDAASTVASTVTSSPVDRQLGAADAPSPGAGRFKPAEIVAPSSTSERVRQEIKARAADRQRAESRARRNKIFRMLVFILILLAVSGGGLWYFGFVQLREGRLVINRSGADGRDAVAADAAEPTTLFGKMGQFLKQNLKQTGSDIVTSVKETVPVGSFGSVAAKIGDTLSNVTATVAEAVRPEAKAAAVAAGPAVTDAHMQWSSLRLEGLFVDKKGVRLARINGQMLKTGMEFDGVKIILITDKAVTVSKGAETRRIKVGERLQ